MEVSIVTTLYRSSSHLPEFYVRVSAAARQLTDSYEIILVNDGSPDNVQDVAVQLCREDSRVRLYELSRNFGHHKAMMTGLKLAQGRVVFLIDCDLEEAPELLLAFHQEMQKKDVDVVYGVQQTRKGNWFERVSGELFYRMLNFLSDCPVPRNLITARLMKRSYVRNLVRHRDRAVFMAGLWATTGFRQVPMTVHKGFKGTSSYDLGRKLSVLVNAVTSFSSKPLVFIFYLGIAILVLSSSAGMTLIARSLFFGHYLVGWLSLVVSIWFLGGLSIFCMGIIAIYLSKVFAEAKDRPYTIIRQAYDQSSLSGGTHEPRRYSQAG